MNIIKLNLILVFLGLLAFAANATVPLPDMVLYGQLFDVNNQRMTVANNGNIEVELQINSATGPDDPIIARATLDTSDEPNVGDIYVLRIPREDGIQATSPNTLVMGDILHLSINGIEVTETSGNAISATDDLEDVRNLDLHLSSVLPPFITTFTAADPSEQRSGIP